MNSTTNATEIVAQPGSAFVDTTREFDAPVAAVWRAHTEADLVAQWLGPRDAGITIETWDKVPGGRYRYVARGGDEEFGFNGVVHSVVPQQRIIETFEFEPFPEAVGVTILNFEDLGAGRTRLTSRDVYPSVESRDAAVASGMEYGVVEGYQRLDDLLTGL